MGWFPKTNKREEENIYTKIKRRRGKAGVSQVGVGAWVSIFHLSKCHFDGANLRGFSIWMRDCVVNIRL